MKSRKHVSQSERVDKNQIGDRGSNNKHNNKSSKKKQSIEYLWHAHFSHSYRSTLVSHRSVWRVFVFFFLLSFFLFLLPSFLPFLFIFLFAPISFHINQRLRTPRMAFLIQRNFSRFELWSLLLVFPHFCLFTALPSLSLSCVVFFFFFFLCHTF